MTTELLDAALLYASLGWRVFPLWPKTKDPMTAHGFKDATTDAEQVRKWWASKPDANVGIATGNGLCVVDVDDKPEKHGGLLGSDFLRDWELEHGEISETACAKSGTGGMHYYFDVGNVEIKGCQSDTIFIDLRCDGNYIVAPPSIHPDTGLPYTWDISPEDMKPAKVTDTDKACIQWVYDHRRGADKDGRKEKVKVPETAIKDGEGRNNFLYEQGCSARAKGSDDDMIYAWLESLNQMKCNPPLDDHELKKIIDSVCSLPVGLSDEAKEAQSKRGRGRPRKFDHAAIAEKLIVDNGACMIDGMPAIRHGDTYKIGWNAINKEVILLERNATRVNQREVQHYLTVMAENKIQSPPNLIAFENGVLDINTMKLRDYQDDDVIPNVIPCDWNENAECEAVDNVLRKMSCSDDDVFESLIEVMGMCMYRSSEFTQSAILLGDGSNGKSTFIRMLIALLGKNNIATISMTQLGKQFLVGRLAGKLANLGSEVSNEFKTGDLLSTFKELVDGNRMHADVKGVEGFDFENYAMMVMCANEFPKLADTTDGMMRRIFPIEFNARFRKTDPDYDPRIAKKVSSVEACEYMALLGIMGLQQVIRNNGFTPNSASDRRLEEIKTENDSALAWINYCGWTADDLNDTPTAKHYANYKEWCSEFGCQAYGHSKFTKWINHHLGLECVKKRLNGVPTNCFQCRNGQARI